MATFNKRRNGDGSTSWDAMVRVVGYPPTGRTFRTKLAAEVWASRTESARQGRTLASARGMTLAHLIDEGIPRLANPTTAIFAYWRERLGDVRLYKITPEMIALHRDRLLGGPCRGHNHISTKALASATVRNYIVELSRLFALAVKELRDNRDAASGHFTSALKIDRRSRRHIHQRCRSRRNDAGSMACRYPANGRALC